MATIKKISQNNKYWWRYREIGILLHCRWDCKVVQLLWKTVWWFLKKLKIKLPCDPAIPFLGIYPKESKAGSWRDICTPVFIAALFTIAKKWKQPKCSSTDKWINEVLYICTVEYYSALKRKEILMHATTWMNLKDIMLSEISQSQKDRYCMIPLIWVPKVIKFIKTESRMVVARGWGKAETESCCLISYRAWVLQDENVPEICFYNNVNIRTTTDLYI